MKFGTVVLVERGSPGNAPGTPGCLRKVSGVLIGARGCNRLVRLLQQDPLATVGYCTQKGDVGWWCDSSVKPA